ncbi:fatty acid desaturase [Palleronia sp. KMU-117]|uniref:fatty acid desaturase n=1 Tax=Palleronia sp. KMU-117 TaxID=3434108 RepID=UPI003D706155
MPRVEWLTLAMLLLCYGLWTVAGLAIWPVAPVAALALMAVMAALHSSLTHECLHGHPTRSRRANELLASLPLTIFYPYRRYQALHLAHHNDERITDPFEDPESYYVARWRHARMPGWLRAVLVVNNTFVGRVVLGPVLGAAGFLRDEARLLADGRRDVRRAWLLHLAGLLPVLALVQAFGIPIWVYVVGVAWPALSLISIRTFAEHRWHEAPEGRTIIVERSPLSWIFLNNNLHIVHHQIPSAPWYALPALYAARAAHWRDLNRGYVYPGYGALFLAHALRPKEPVVHPALQREAPVTDIGPETLLAPAQDLISGLSPDNDPGAPRPGGERAA